MNTCPLTPSHATGHVRCAVWTGQGLYQPDDRLARSALAAPAAIARTETPPRSPNSVTDTAAPPRLSVPESHRHRTSHETSALGSAPTSHSAATAARPGCNEALTMTSPAYDERWPDRIG